MYRARLQCFIVPNSWLLIPNNGLSAMVMRHFERFLRVKRRENLSAASTKPLKCADGTETRGTPIGLGEMETLY